MKNKLKNINKVDVLKAFFAAHVYTFVAVAVVGLLYVVVSSIFGRDAVDIVSYAQTAGIFSVLGILAFLAAIIAVYKAVTKYLFDENEGVANGVALEILFIVSAIFLFFVISDFNILSYLVVMLVPTIVAYYVAKREARRD